MDTVSVVAALSSDLCVSGGKDKVGFACLTGTQLLEDVGSYLRRERWFCVSGSRVESCKTMGFRLRQTGCKSLL